MVKFDLDRDVPGDAMEPPGESKDGRKLSKTGCLLFRGRRHQVVFYGRSKLVHALSLFASDVAVFHR